MKLPPPKRLRRRLPRGFTLIELLVATAVTALLGVLLLGAAQGMINGYTRIQAQVFRESDLAFTLDQLTADLEGLVLPNQPNAQALQIRPDPNAVGDVENPMWLTFLATVTDEDNSFPDNPSLRFDGATRAVSYRLAFQNTIPDSRRTADSYGIYRSVSSARHTFQHALNLADLQTDYWPSPPASPDPAPGSPTALSNLLSENVVNFALRFQYFDDSGNEMWTTPTDTITISRNEATRNGEPIPGGFRRVEISVTALSPEGAKRVEAGMPLADAIGRYGKTSIRQTSFLGR